MARRGAAASLKKGFAFVMLRASFVQIDTLANQMTLSTFETVPINISRDGNGDSLVTLRTTTVLRKPQYNMQSTGTGACYCILPVLVTISPVDYKVRLSDYRTECY